MNPCQTSPAGCVRANSTVDETNTTSASSLPQISQLFNSYSTSLPTNMMATAYTGNDFSFQDMLHSDAMADDNAAYGFEPLPTDAANAVPTTSAELNFDHMALTTSNATGINPAHHAFLDTDLNFNFPQYNTTQIPANMPSSFHARRVLPSPPQASSSAKSSQSSQCINNTKAMQAEITRLNTQVSGLNEKNTVLKNHCARLQKGIGKVEFVSRQLHNHSSKQQSDIAQLNQVAAFWKQEATRWETEATKAIHVAKGALKQLTELKQQQQQIPTSQPEQPLRQEQPVAATQPRAASPHQSQPSVASSSQTQPIQVESSPAPEQPSPSSPIQPPRSRTKVPDWVISRDKGSSQALHPKPLYKNKGKEKEVVKLAVKRTASPLLSSQPASQPAKKKQKKSKEQKKKGKERATKGAELKVKDGLQWFENLGWMNEQGYVMEPAEALREETEVQVEAEELVEEVAVALEPNDEDVAVFEAMWDDPAFDVPQSIMEDPEEESEEG